MKHTAGSIRTAGLRSCLAALALFLIAALVTGCGGAAQEGPAPNDAELILYSTTSVRDAGLMEEVVLPAYEAAHPEVTVKPIYVGSGEAIQAARDGLADVIVVHSPADEMELLADGVATLRLPFAYNHFTIVGPEGDPAGVAEAGTAAEALARIAEYGETMPSGEVAFVSRGDDSGTNKKELKLWSTAGVSAAGEAPAAPWYITAAGGMLPCLQVAAEKDAYTLTDTATWLKNEEILTPLVSVARETDDLKNQYSVLLLNQALHGKVASTNAEWLAAYLVSHEGQQAIADFGVADYGRPLFTPNASSVADEP